MLSSAARASHPAPTNPQQKQHNRRFAPLPKGGLAGLIDGAPCDRSTHFFDPLFRPLLSTPDHSYAPDLRIVASVSQDRTLAARYVRALNLGGMEAAAADRLNHELAEWAEAAAKGQPLHALVANPTLPRAAQAATLRELAQNHGASAALQSLLVLLSGSRRLVLLPAIAEGFADALRLSRGQSLAEIVSARPLNEAQKQAVQQAVGDHTEIRYREDAALLGGLVLHQGGNTLDLSVEAQLERTRRALLAA